ncbi:hypothetical protein LC55x_2444 [Lysobacter capsici]|nr:hypothetical protein LC55x_2444 [Lysobacter capsici]
MQARAQVALALFRLESVSASQAAHDRASCRWLDYTATGSSAVDE